MLLVDQESSIEIEPVEAGEETRLSVSLRSQTFSGSYDQVWVSRARLERFATDLRRLEAERAGEAVLESFSPREFRLAFRAMGPAGAIAADVSLTRHQYAGPGRYANTVACGIEVAGEDLGRLIDEVEEEFGVSASPTPPPVGGDPVDVLPERFGGPPRWLPGLASLLLLATGLFHATGIGGVVEVVADPAFAEFYKRALPGVWIFFSWHLLALALGAGWAAVRRNATARPLLVFLALVAAVDTLFVGAAAGPLFAGTLMLAGAAACLAIAAARWPSA